MSAAERRSRLFRVEAARFLGLAPDACLDLPADRWEDVARYMRYAQSSLARWMGRRAHHI